MISRSPLKNIGLNLSTPSVVNRLGSAASTGAIDATHIDKAKTCSALQLKQPIDHPAFRQHTQLGASLSINAGQFHDRRADHQRRDWIAERILAELVAGSEHSPCGKSGTGPQREIAARPMIARRAVVDLRSAAELAHADHQRVVDQSSLVQVLQ